MTVTFPNTEPWQKDVFDFYRHNPNGKWVVVNSVRQIGKSTLAQLLLIYGSLDRGGSVSICISPVLSQSRKMFEDVQKMARELITKANGSSLEITFINNSKILFKSGEQADTIRGNTVKGSGIVVCDEAAYLKDDLFYSIIVPTTNVYNADIFIFSTPRLKQGFFYNLYMQGFTDNEKVHSFDWTKYDTSKYLSADTLEIYRQRMPKRSFQSEFLGQFLDGMGSVFSDFTECVEKYDLISNLPIYIGVDWGGNTGNDNTAITIGQMMDGKARISQIIAFNDKTTNETIDYIVSLVNALKTKTNDLMVTCEKNSIGNVFFQLLYDRLDGICDCGLFVTTNKSKDRIIKQLINSFEKGLITIPDDQQLIVELSAYECKANQNGILTYNAANGFRDDRVMSLAICLDSFYIELT